jgi:AcrR family transcriptional regulator
MRETMTSSLKRRTPNQKRARKTQAQILESAEAILNSEGTRKLTSRRLAREAGVSVGVIYDYFPSMRALLFWIYEVRLNKRLAIFEEAMLGESLKIPLKQAFPAYVSRMTKENMWSRADLELHTAAEDDPKFGDLVAGFQEELTDHYCEMFSGRGSDLSKTDLRRIALYSHAVDRAGWALRLNAEKDERLFYGRLSSRVSLMLMEQAGILTPQESEEIFQSLAV